MRRILNMALAAVLMSGLSGLTRADDVDAKAIVTRGSRPLVVRKSSANQAATPRRPRAPSHSTAMTMKSKPRGPFRTWITIARNSKVNSTATPSRV